MELLKEIILVMVGIVFVMFLIVISSRLLNSNPNSSGFVIKGDKQQIINTLVNLISKCYAENKDRIDSVICSQSKIEFNSTINSTEIMEKISHSEIYNKVSISDLVLSPNTTSNIIIRYENEFIYVGVVQGERIGN